MTAAERMTATEEAVAACDGGRRKNDEKLRDRSSTQTGENEIC